MKELVLASKSPQRIKILTDLGLTFTVYSPDFIEKNSISSEESIEDVVIHNAIGKAQEASRRFKDAIIISVDTIGVSHGHILGKPTDEEDAKRLIRLISGTEHSVVSGICVMNSKSGKTLTQAVETKVEMEKIDEKDIEKYIKTGEGDGKAGAYAIQGKGSLFIKGIKGDYFNVVGLPIYALKKLLKEFQIKIL